MHFNLQLIRSRTHDARHQERAVHCVMSRCRDLCYMRFCTCTFGILQQTSNLSRGQTSNFVSNSENLQWRPLKCLKSTTLENVQGSSDPDAKLAAFQILVQFERRKPNLTSLNRNRPFSCAFVDLVLIGRCCSSCRQSTICFA